VCEPLGALPGEPKDDSKKWDGELYNLSENKEHIFMAGIYANGSNLKHLEAFVGKSSVTAVMITLTLMTKGKTLWV